MKALWLAVVVGLCACGAPSAVAPVIGSDVDAGSVDAGVDDAGVVVEIVQDGGFVDGGALLTDGGAVPPPRVVRPLYFGTSDFPVTPGAAGAMDSLFGAVAARFSQETRLKLNLAPAKAHQSAKSCAQLGADAVAMLTTIANELAPDGSQKFQVIVPCEDPTQTSAGIAYITGHVAVTFDGARALGSASSQALLSTVAMHELGHTLGLIHNSVGNNCMGPTELRSFALGLLGDTETAPCVFLPYQRAKIIAAVPLFVTDVPATSFAATAPGLLATPSKLTGKWEVSLSWLGGAGAGAAGWHIEREGLRILRVRSSSSSDKDSDGAAEYHNDPAMTDPGLVDGGRYCYRLRQYDASGTEGPVGAETCVNL